ncbi:MAG: ATP-binding protein [Symploca sp. SIO2C1]|nr:ATP-binding protein [Symploca sp. SIO2C1]
MEPKGTLIFFCGKMGAGKTSMSIELSKDKNTVLLSEDTWLSQIYPHQIASFDDYLKFSRQIRPLVKNLAQDILRTGTNVVMDFPANTASQRDWFKNLSAEVESPYEMIYLDASNEICLKHIAKRQKEQPERSNFDTKEVFLKITQYFEKPEETERLNIRKIEVRT